MNKNRNSLVFGGKVQNNTKGRVKIWAKLKVNLTGQVSKLTCIGSTDSLEKCPEFEQAYATYMGVTLSCVEYKQ